MIKFISLTEARGNDVTEPLVLNAAHIQHIQHMQVSKKGKDTHIRMGDGSFFFVRESLEEVVKLASDAPKPAQPIAMNAVEYDRYMTAKDARDNAFSNVSGLSSLNPVQLGV